MRTTLLSHLSSLLFIQARHNALYKCSFLLEPVICHLLPDFGVLLRCYRFYGNVETRRDGSMVRYHWLVPFVVHAFHVGFCACLPEYAVTPKHKSDQALMTEDYTHQAGIRFLADWSNSLEFGVYLYVGAK